MSAYKGALQGGPYVRAHRSFPDEFQARSVDGPEVVDNFPHILPVTAHELEIIETYLGRVITDLLKG